MENENQFCNWAMTEITNKSGTTESELRDIQKEIKSAVSEAMSGGDLWLSVSDDVDVLFFQAENNLVISFYPALDDNENAAPLTKPSLISLDAFTMANTAEEDVDETPSFR